MDSARQPDPSGVGGTVWQENTCWRRVGTGVTSVACVLSALEELADATVVAVARRRLDVGQAKQLVGELVLDAAGVTIEATEWREELVGAGLDPGLVDRTYAEMCGLARPDDVTAPVSSGATGEPIEMLLEHIKVLGDPAGWPAATTYASLALAVIDSLWSIGVRYTGVRNVIARYRAFRSRDGADADHDTPADLADAIDGAGGPGAFAEIVANRQRTSSRGGILKAEAVRFATDVLIDASLMVPADVASAMPDQLMEVRERWTAIRGQGSGLSWDYFLMLSGRPGVKADRMVRRFVADALKCDEQDISPADAHELVTEAAGLLGLGVSQLDFAIWLHQSGNAPT